MKKIQTLNNYLDRKEDEELLLSNFTEVDTAIFATICLIDTLMCIPTEDSEEKKTFKEVMEEQIKEHGVNKLGALLPLEMTEILVRASKSKRYSGIKLYNLHINISSKLSTQSTFLMADLTEKTKIVIFGSTDDTVVGWEEDLKLIIDHDVECLKEAKEYVERHCSLDNRYIFIGHSKGGMESAYALLTASKELQGRILVAYDLDGPGFTKEFVEEYKHNPALDKLKLICPKGSFIGRMFHQPVKSIVCPSTAIGLLQHNPNSWVIKGNHFKRLKAFSKRTSILVSAVNNYVESLKEQEAKEIVNGVMKIIGSGRTKTLTMLISHPIRIIKGMKRLSKAERKAIASIPLELVKEEIKEIRN